MPLLLPKVQMLAEDLLNYYQREDVKDKYRLIENEINTINDRYFPNIKHIEHFTKC